MAGGDLKSFLRETRPRPVSENQPFPVAVPEDGTGGRKEPGWAAWEATYSVEPRESAHGLGSGGKAGERGQKVADGQAQPQGVCARLVQQLLQAVSIFMAC